jgi:hypothetical protein
LVVVLRQPARFVSGPHQAAAVADPARRRRPGSASGSGIGVVSFCLCGSTPAPGAAQRYVCLAETRRTARTWQFNTSAAAMRPATQVSAYPRPTAARSRRLPAATSNFAAWEQNGPYNVALLIKSRSAGASTKHLYRSGSSTTADHILWLPPAPRRTCVTKPVVAARSPSPRPSRS